MNDTFREQTDGIVSEFASEALRNITFAYRDLQEDDGGPGHANDAVGDDVKDVERKD